MRLKHIRVSLIMYAVFVLVQLPGRAQQSSDAPAVSAEPRQDKDLSGLHAFDLRAGCWIFHNHVLKERLANNHDWFDYDSTQHLWITMGGYGNMDDNEMRTPAGTYYGVTVRTYDPKTGTWSIWWYDSRNPSDLDPPVKGRFQGGVGIFYSDDTLRGKPIKVRFTWSGITATAAHWEQAYSGDGARHGRPTGSPSSARSIAQNRSFQSIFLIRIQSGRLAHNAIVLGKLWRQLAGMEKGCQHRQFVGLQSINHLAGVESEGAARVHP